MIKKTTISFEKANFFSKLFLDYADDTSRKKLTNFYSYEPDVAGIKKFIEENNYNTLDRNILKDELLAQGNLVNNTSDQTKKNIQLLADKNTYTITTGHQLCLATGPAYFIYKIISVINICESLQKQIPDANFIPVYWMASEDHDFEEINHIHLFGKKITWNTSQKGKVGEFSLQDIEPFLAEIKQALGESDVAASIFNVLQNAYTQNNLADATRYLVNELFGKYGVVVVDGNSKTFKQQFIAEIKENVFKNTAFKNVTSTTENLKQQGYETQVMPREINIFYTDKNLRERIVKENNSYKVLNTDMVFSQEEIEKLINEQPEKFSPNVVLRPVYQQKILPNAMYVGGPAEAAYWLQYKAMFTQIQISYPIVVPRNFVLYIDKGLNQRMEKLQLTSEDFFNGKDKLIKNYALKQQPFDLEKQKEELKTVYASIKTVIALVDKTLEASTEAELQKNVKGLEMLEQKGIRAIKQKNEQAITQIETIYGRLFPNDTPQERVENFLRFYLNNINFIDDVKNNTFSFIEEKAVAVLHEV